jgi:hypothetical protein
MGLDRDIDLYFGGELRVKFGTRHTVVRKDI